MSHVQAMGAAEREGPVQGRLYRSLKLWTFYCDLEESLGTPESTRAAYDRIMELRIATPQIVLNYAAFLQACLLPGLAYHVDADAFVCLFVCPFVCLSSSLCRCVPWFAHV